LRLLFVEVAGYEHVLPFGLSLFAGFGYERQVTPDLASFRQWGLHPVGREGHPYIRGGAGRWF
jgi:hypothetical protein